MHQIRLRGATSRYRATWNRRDSPTRCANEGAATTRQGHGLVDPNETAHALARTRHWRWYSYLSPCPTIPIGTLPIIWQVRCDPRHNFGVCPMAERRATADLGRGGPRAEGAKRSLPQTFHQATSRARAPQCRRSPNGSFSTAQPRQRSKPAEDEARSNHPEQ
jgi:hypothetical protein